MKLLFCLILLSFSIALFSQCGHGVNEISKFNYEKNYIKIEKSPMVELGVISPGFFIYCDSIQKEDRLLSVSICVSLNGDATRTYPDMSQIKGILYFVKKRSRRKYVFDASTKREVQVFDTALDLSVLDSCYFKLLIDISKYDGFIVYRTDLSPIFISIKELIG